MTVGAEQVISVMLLHSFSHMEKECGESERQVVALQADVRGGKGEEQNYMLHYSIGLLEVPKSKVKWKYVKVHTRKTVFNVHPLSHFPLKFSQRTKGVPLFPINRFDFVTTFVSTLSSFCWILKLLISPAAVRSYLVCQIPSSSHQNQYPEVCSLSSSKVLHALPSLPAGSSILLIPSSSYSSVGAAQQL